MSLVVPPAEFIILFDDRVAEFVRGTWRSSAIAWPAGRRGGEGSDVVEFDVVDDLPDLFIEVVVPMNHAVRGHGKQQNRRYLNAQRVRF